MGDDGIADAPITDPAAADVVGDPPLEGDDVFSPLRSSEFS